MCDMEMWFQMIAHYIIMILFVALQHVIMLSNTFPNILTIF